MHCKNIKFFTQNFLICYFSLLIGFDNKKLEQITRQKVAESKTYERKTAADYWLLPKNLRRQKM